MKSLPLFKPTVFSIVRIVGLSILLVLLTLSCGSPEDKSQTEEPAGSHILIYTRNGPGPDGGGYVHDNIQASVEALQSICTDLGCTSEVSDDAGLFVEGGLSKYDMIIFSNSNNEAFDSQEQRDVFKKYINEGGGFMGVHSACGSEREWSWYWAMLGGKFVRHPPEQDFDIHIIDPDHISTKHLPAVWKWADECYYLDQLNPDIQVLIAADLTTVEDESRSDYPGTIFGDYFPLAWYHEYDGGRQFYTALGHQPAHYSDPNFVAHLKGGIQWVMDTD